MNPLTCQRELFDLPESVSYLNTAYMSPLLRSVEAAGMEGVRRKSRPYHIIADDFFSFTEQMKQTFAQLLDTDDAQRIAVIPSASYGIANVCKNIQAKAGQEVLVVEEQFPSNMYSWMRLAEEKDLSIKIASPASSGQNKGADWNQAILDAIHEKTAVVTLPHLHWAEGIRFDLAAIRQKTLEVGALMIIDGTQSIGALPFSLKEIPVDALVCSGYKWLLGPYSIGLAYYGEAFDQGTPIEETWMNRLNSEDFSGLVQYEDRYKPKANRYNVGEFSNFIHLPMLNTAIQQINEWGVDRIQAYCKQLSDPYLEQLRSHGFQILGEDQRVSHLFGISLPEGIDKQQLKAQLAEDQIYVSIRGNFVRIACHVFNTSSDFERLLGHLI